MINLALALIAFRYLPTLMAFAPLITKSYFEKNLEKSLYTALLYGAIVDLFSSQTHFGITIINYTLTTLLIHRLKWRLNPHKIYSIFIFTLIFSFTSTTISLLISDLPFELKEGLLVSPLLDALYAFIWFSCPQLIYDRCNIQWRKYRHG